MSLRVAVIGAGAAGLVALRHLVHHPQVKAVAFEQSRNVGGTWVYTEHIGTDDLGLPVHSSMYANLKTNLPKEVMAFPDFPFTNSENSFVTHKEVLDYLQSYCEHFKLSPHIKFTTCVEKVKPVIADDATKWQLTTCEVTSGSKEEHEFDAVVVCNGHYSVPRIPSLPGLEKFKGQVIHSHDYRHPEGFAGKRVAILGAAASGTDIGIDIAAFADEVILCHHNKPLKSPLLENMKQAASIKSLTETDLVLDDGSVLSSIDVLIFCTGYHYTFPFLGPECHPKIEDNWMPLYKQIVSPHYPTLGFIGIPQKVAPFPQFSLQVRFFIAGITGAAPFPSEDVMLEDIQSNFDECLSQGMPVRHFFYQGSKQWAYNKELADLAQIQPLNDVVRLLYDEVWEKRSMFLVTYKKRSYQITGPDSYSEIEIKE